jgi:hypothetical protein
MSCYLCLRGNWVVAARVGGVATTNAFGREPHAFEGTMGVEGFDRVLGAGGIKSAAGHHERRDEETITAHETNQ